MTTTTNTGPRPDDPQYPHVHVQLTGRDGNVFAIIGAICAALRRDVGPDAAARFSDNATACHSYDEVLQLAMRTVDIT